MKVCHTFLCTFIAKEILLNRSGFEQLKLNPEYLKFYKKKNLNNLFITFRFTKKKKHLSNFPNLIRRHFAICKTVFCYICNCEKSKSK